MADSVTGFDRLRELRQVLEDDGVVDVKFAFDAAALETLPASEVANRAADFIEAYLEQRKEIRRYAVFCNQALVHVHQPGGSLGTQNYILRAMGASDEEVLKAHDEARAAIAPAEFAPSDTLAEALGEAYGCLAMVAVADDESRGKLGRAAKILREACQALRRRPKNTMPAKEAKA